MSPHGVLFFGLRLAVFSLLLSVATMPLALYVPCVLCLCVSVWWWISIVRERWSYRISVAMRWGLLDAWGLACHF